MEHAGDLAGAAYSHISATAQRYGALTAPADRLDDVDLDVVEPLAAHSLDEPGPDGE